MISSIINESSWLHNDTLTDNVCDATYGECCRLQAKQIMTCVSVCVL